MVLQSYGDAALFCIFNGIINEVYKYLFQLKSVSRNGRRVLLSFNF